MGVQEAEGGVRWGNGWQQTGGGGMGGDAIKHLILGGSDIDI